MTDFLIIGGGIVGLATAVKLQEAYPNKSIILLEKEKSLASHQTGHNSGVIHSGLYYKPGSLKARNCINGYNQLVDFCSIHSIKHDICGKIVVATDSSELPYLQTLKERGKENGLEGILELNETQLKDYEPHVAGIAGLYVPQTGIVDYLDVANKYGEIFESKGGEIQTNERVTGIYSESNNHIVETDRSTFHTHYLINCAGLYSDHITKLSKDLSNYRIIPFRGEYFKLVDDKQYLVKNLIYPVPNPNFPFLGVHFTRMINGGIEAGPNAVLAFKKEGYSKQDINMKELINSLTWPGFLKVASKYWSTGLGEMYRSFSKQAFTKALQKLLPEIESKDLITGGAGVRAQACDKNGGLVDDFLIVQDDNQLHIVNAPSPAATSSLSIADEVVGRIKKSI